MQANTTSANKKIPPFDHAALAGAQPLPPAAPCVCATAYQAVSTTPAVASTLQDKQPESANDGSETHLLEPFCWYHGGAQTPEHEVIEQAHDIATGIMEILTMIEGDEVSVDCAGGRLLSPSRRANLMRLAITSARMLSEECSGNIDYVNEKRRGK